eukprot:5781362-Alexandrium_andersonii.AAC.1
MCIRDRASGHFLPGPHSNLGNVVHVHPGRCEGVALPSCNDHPPDERASERDAIYQACKYTVGDKNHLWVLQALRFNHTRAQMDLNAKPQQPGRKTKAKSLPEEDLRQDRVKECLQ